ncbi:anhydro-N-acetylmuramic acid kinase [Candidatus Parabeggiatoa sp. HSG14]|uniref:anhydro-N-acetylmuramic acid kinase n=1 Tax=Candidatus Parabeggiatoa sp. HSG14 TaxID=3055593 RepID=UPI0025A80603|nr:anhydro-N-acetylmuramic acid kinase [Thiotrichales bacterium HSG14]
MKNEKRLFIGLMSGTSVDAIDAVLVEFTVAHNRVIATHSHTWPFQLRESLLVLSQQKREQSTLHEIATLDIQTAELFAEATLALLEKAQILPKQICAIGSPGQTLYHHPEGTIPYTWQIGDPNVIAQITGIPTIADFRRRDVAAGGQGAPLAPAFHNFLLRSSQENRVVLNIGGIANITVLPANENQPVIGFDTGPGNALLDAYVSQQKHQRMDKSGIFAATGKMQPSLLESMLADPYFSRPAPKSTGRDYFNLDWLTHLLSHLSLPPEDIQATLNQLTITSIAQATLPYKPQRLLVCGGGVHNPLLMAGLAKQLPDCIVESTEAVGIDPDLVEAISFAWLAQQRMDKQPSNLPSVTGAQQAVVLGGIYV